MPTARNAGGAKRSRSKSPTAAKEPVAGATDATPRSSRRSRTKEQRELRARMNAEKNRHVCACERVIGGPSTKVEKCECGLLHVVHRGGSWDWGPKLCSECRFKDMFGEKSSADSQKGDK